MHILSAIRKAPVFVDLLGFIFLASFVEAQEEVRVYISNADVTELNQGPFLQNIDEMQSYLGDVRDEIESSSRRSLMKDRNMRNCNSSNDRQTVYLEFPNRPTFGACLLTGTPETFDSYIFSDEDKQFVLERLEADFDGFKIDFVLEEPSGCDFSTLTFAPPEGLITVGSPESKSGILFGRADQIDFRNRDHMDNAFVDGSFWTWILQFSLFEDPVSTFFSASGLDPATPVEEALRIATLNEVSNTGAHELGHILGIRHYDSFGSQEVKNGAFFTESDGLFYYEPDDQTGTETLMHIMASEATVGLPLSGGSAQDRFFSERSAIKMLLGTKGNDLSYNEAKAKQLGGTIGTNKPGMKLNHFTVPNVIVESQFSGKNLATSVTIIEEAFIETEDEVDQYRFRFERGQFINAEIISFVSLLPYDDVVITGLSVFRDNDGTLEPLITSHQEFEDYDPLIFDFEITEDGDYVIEVFAQKCVCVYDQFECFYLSENGDENLTTGQYDLFVYSVNRALGPF